MSLFLSVDVTLHTIKYRRLIISIFVPSPNSLSLILNIFLPHLLSLCHSFSFHFYHFCQFLSPTSLITFFLFPCPFLYLLSFQSSLSSLPLFPSLSLSLSLSTSSLPPIYIFLFLSIFLPFSLFLFLSPTLRLCRTYLLSNPISVLVFAPSSLSYCEVTIVTSLPSLSLYLSPLFNLELPPFGVEKRTEGVF